MSFLFAHPKKSVPEFTGLQIQTAVNVLPIPIVFGCPRVPMNIIYANGFKAVKQKSSSGKGLLSGGKGGGDAGFKYFITFIGVIGEGPIENLVATFDNQAVYAFGSPPDGKEYVFFPGDPTPDPWDFIVSHWPADAFGYAKTAYVACPDYPLDSSATIPFLNFVPLGLFHATCPLHLFTPPTGSPFLMDADPAKCVNALLTDPTFGVGFPAAFIDYATLNTGSNGYVAGVGDAALSTYCQAIGFGWSLALNNTEPASSILDRLLKNLVVAPVWTGSILKFVPYYDSYVALNPGWDASAGIALKYYRPNIPVLFDLTDSYFVQASPSDDPVTVSRIDVAEAKNTVRLDFKNRNNEFNNDVAEAKDENAAELYGPRVERMGAAEEFTLNDYANLSAQLRLQRNLGIRNAYTFKLGPKWCVLDPMDVITITDETLKLDRLPVRITSIEEDERGVLTIAAEEFPLGAATATQFTHQGNLPPTIDPNATAPAVNEPAIFEPTNFLLAAQGLTGLQIAIAACGGPGGTFDPNWGGCHVWASDDDVTYGLRGTLVGPSTMGVTTATLAAYAGTNPDVTHTLSVNVSESDGVLDTVTAAQAASGTTSLVAVVEADGSYELLSYTTATLTSPGHYDLTGLYRGLYGTTACAHPSGIKLVKVDADVLEGVLPPAYADVPVLYFKLQSFNIFNRGTRDLADCTAYAYTPVGAGTQLVFNAIWQALAAGQDVDLEAISGSLDLNAGGAGGCAPIIGIVDLGVG